MAGQFIKENMQISNNNQAKLPGAGRNLGGVTKVLVAGWVIPPYIFNYFKV